jgi:hypothetical protein
MKPIIDLISYLISFIVIPVIAILYTIILVLFGIAELFNYLFTKYENKRMQLLRKILQPFEQK